MKRFFVWGLCVLLSACQSTFPVYVPQVFSNAPLLRQTHTQASPYFSSAFLQVSDPVHLERALTALRLLQKSTRQEAGNLEFVVQQDVNDPQQIIIWEVFRSEADFQEHLKTPHLQAFLQVQGIAFVQGLPAYRSQMNTPINPQSYLTTLVLSLSDATDLGMVRQQLKQLEARALSQGVNWIAMEVSSTESPTFVLWGTFKDQAVARDYFAGKPWQQFMNQTQVRIGLRHEGRAL